MKTRNQFSGVKLLILVGLAAISFVESAPTKSLDTCSLKVPFPKARRDSNVIDNHFGIKVADPYQWLEDPYSNETKKYVKDANSISKPFLENCNHWSKLRDKMIKRINYPRNNIPRRIGDYYFSYKNTGLQNQDILHKQKSLSSEPEVFLDPNLLSTDGTIAISRTSFSNDGRKFTYSLSESGSDWVTVRIRDVTTGVDFPEILNKMKQAQIAWTSDNKGFFYNCYDVYAGNTDGTVTTKNINEKVYYHRVGEPQEKDVLVVEFPENPEWRTFSQISGTYLILLTQGNSTSNNIINVADLSQVDEITGKLEIKPIIRKLIYDYSVVTSAGGSKFIIRTNKNAPNYRLIKIDFENPSEKNWEEFIKEDEEAVLISSYIVHNDKLVVNYIQNVRSALKLYDLNTGKLIKNIPLEFGSIVEFSGSKSTSEIFYQLTSFIMPGKIYKYDLATPEIEPTLLYQNKFQIDEFDQDNYLIEQMFYPSYDGTKIPMYIVQKKGHRGGKPCLLYGYGGFNIALLPTFNTLFLTFVDAFDGVLAIPNIRGGGEKGTNWHNAGKLFTKQNSYDDFQAAAEYLVTNNYTEHKKIAIYGRSNGGLLVCASINQRPDLFGAAIAQVGVMDIVRYHKFTIGFGWIDDYGNPDEEKYFRNLFKFSPLHNVRRPRSEKEQYPSTLILTADHDDRVSPLHSLKFGAALHHAVNSTEYQKNPIILRVYDKTGHGAGRPTLKVIDEAADILSFLYRTLRVDTDI